MNKQAIEMAKRKWKFILDECDDDEIKFTRKKIKIFESSSDEEEEEGQSTCNEEDEESDSYESDFIDNRSEDELSIYSDGLPENSYSSESDSSDAQPTPLQQSENKPSRRRNSVWRNKNILVKIKITRYSI